MRCEEASSILGGIVCKRYDDREPLGNQKVSHFSKESAMLEKKLQESGGKERCIL